jgi:hypothetical protein
MRIILGPAESASGEGEASHGTIVYPFGEGRVGPLLEQGLSRRENNYGGMQR